MTGLASNGTGRAKTCGECTVCCNVLAIPEVSKPENSECNNCGIGGCSIYDSRPSSCRLYRCAWLNDADAPISLRPDSSHVLAHLMPYEEEGESTARLVALELVNGALDDVCVATWLRDLSGRLSLKLVGAKWDQHKTYADRTLVLISSDGTKR